MRITVSRIIGGSVEQIRFLERRDEAIVSHFCPGFVWFYEYGLRRVGQPGVAAHESLWRYQQTIVEPGARVMYTFGCADGRNAKWRNAAEETSGNMDLY